MYGYTTSIQSVCSPLAVEKMSVKQLQPSLINLRYDGIAKVPFQAAFEQQKTADSKCGPSRQQVRKINLCVYANGTKSAKSQTCHLSLLLASQGRHQSQRELVAKKQHRCSLASGEGTSHCHPCTRPRQRHPPRQRTHSGALHPQWSQPGSFEKYSL